MDKIKKEEHYIFTEFSFELGIAIPHMNYLIQKGGKDIVTRSFPDNECLYFWSKEHKADLKQIADGEYEGQYGLHVLVDDKLCQLDNLLHGYYYPATGLKYGDYYKLECEIKNVIFPDFKSHFSKLAKDNGMSFDKPLIVINNKSVVEWGIKGKVVNRIELEDIGLVYELYKDSHQIIYLRPHNNMKNKGYVVDCNINIEWNDKEFIKENYPNIIIDEELMDNYPDLGFNEIQCMVHSLSDMHISVAGGNAVIASYFGGTNIVVGDAIQNGQIRMVWATNSHLKNISGSKIIGVHDHQEFSKVIKKIKEEEEICAEHFAKKDEK